MRAIPGVAAASERYQADVADSFRLGEPLRHGRLPRRPHRVRGAAARRGPAAARPTGRPRSASASPTRSGCGRARRSPSRSRAAARPASASAASSGRSSTTGGSRTCGPARLLAAQPDVGSTISVRLAPGADRAGRGARRSPRSARRRGPPPAATTRNAAFLGVLATVLRGVGLAVGLVCLYALVQALAMTARERRGAVALLRACGGDATTVAAVLAGAALVVALPAALAGGGARVARVRAGRVAPRGGVRRPPARAVRRPGRARRRRPARAGRGGDGARRPRARCASP